MSEPEKREERITGFHSCPFRVVACVLNPVCFGALKPFFAFPVLLVK
jgi:hypothetical protein